jgi:osmotically-inducible protein OsmY
MRVDAEIKRDVEDELRWDPDIVRDAVNAVKAELPLSSNDIKLIAKGGWLTLEGALDWNYTRERAESAVKRIRCVKGVTNFIVVKPKVMPYQIRRKIEDALRRARCEPHHRRSQR